MSNNLLTVTNCHVKVHLRIDEDYHTGIINSAPDSYSLGQAEKNADIIPKCDIYPI